MQQYKLVGKLKHKSPFTNYLTNLLHIIMLTYGTRPAGWYSKRTVTHHNCHDHNHVAEQEVFSTWGKRQTMISTEALLYNAK